MKLFLAGCFALFAITTAHAQESQSPLRATAAEKALMMLAQRTVEQQISPCLNPGHNASSATVRVMFNRDGTLASKPFVIDMVRLKLGADGNIVGKPTVVPSDRKTANAVIRALLLCITPDHPLRFGSALYKSLRVFDYTVLPLQ